MVRQEQRMVTLGLTLRYNKMVLVLEPSETASALARKAVMVVEYPNGRLEVQHEGKVVPHLQYDKANQLVVNPPLDVAALEAEAAEKKRAQEYEQMRLLYRAETHSYKPVVQWFQAACKVHDKETVGQMLFRQRGLVGKHHYGSSALHFAAGNGHDKVVEQLLTEFPQLADATDLDGGNALHLAARCGHENAVKLLLALAPNCVNALERYGKTPLHNAVKGGYENIVKLLLKAKPELAAVATSDEEWTALHFAANSGRYDIAEILLEFQSDLAFDVTKDEDTVLHLACASPCRSQEFFEKLIEYDPSALRALDDMKRSPFQVAVLTDNDAAVEALKREVPFDELFSSDSERYHAKFRPLVEEECDELVETLGKDVAGEVFEFLGFQRVRNQNPHINETYDYDRRGGNPKLRKKAKRA